nr:unnamed protein product [Fasciola hepatica]
MPGKFEGQGRMMSVGLEYMHTWKCFWCTTEHERHMDKNLVEAFGELFTLLQMVVYKVVAVYWRNHICCKQLRISWEGYYQSDGGRERPE